MVEVVNLDWLFKMRMRKTWCFHASHESFAVEFETRLSVNWKDGFEERTYKQKKMNYQIQKTMPKSFKQELRTTLLRTGA